MNKSKVSAKKRTKISRDKIAIWFKNNRKRVFICACGCGILIKLIKRYYFMGIPKYFFNHHTKVNKPKGMAGRKHTDKWKQERSDSMKGVKHYNFGKQATEETKRKQSKSHEGQQAWNKGLNLTEEHIKNLSISHIGNVGWNKGKTGIYDENTLKVMSEKTKKLWKDSEFVKKQMKSRNVMPNKTEMYLQDILNSIFFEGQFVYVGDGKEIIGGKCPDFIDKVNNKIIELYGDYWHRGQDPNDRINYFKDYGYDTLVIWESELKDIKILERKLLKCILV